ncbi:hypothetical protein V3391_07680 [Luteimonas sp. SMYT11W]|uniref:AlpA family phage regulatory protein n=1 Tax=Luteimonas flava TaxID=3115822 RepID=A0ABU7WDN6_9GAMM
MTPHENPSSNSGVDARAEALERWLILELGPVIKGANLRRLLGYSSAEAFRQAIHRKKLPIVLRRLPGQTSWCAATRDVAVWMAQAEASLATEAKPLSDIPSNPDKDTA